MKKTLFLIFALCITLFAEEGIKTEKADSILAEINRVISVSPKGGALLKGMFYEYGYPEEKIKPNYEKAYEFYQKAYLQGSPIAGFKLGYAEWVKEEKTKSKTSNALKYFLSAASMEPKAQARLNMVAAGIYLYQKQEFGKAIRILREPALVSDATAEFYTALAYHALGKMAQANTFLTRACTNKKSHKDIQKFCTGDTHVEKVDLREQGSISKRRETYKHEISGSSCAG